jgi:hypothetical protein
MHEIHKFIDMIRQYNLMKNEKTLTCSNNTKLKNLVIRQNL